MIEQATTCCVVGGGPAGVMLGYLLASANVRVVVLEKHNDFFRDFRGDTVHPSTLDILYELDLLDDFLKIPHQEVQSVGGIYGDFALQAADFCHVAARSKFVAFMPQWDFLRFLSDRAQRFPAFDLRMNHEAIGLIHQNGRVAGVVARDPQGAAVNIRADLVVGCDGRHSVVRRAAGLELVEFGVPIDVLWFRVRREPDDPNQLLGTINYGKALVLINRNEYFQAGLIIRKGSYEEIQSRGLDSFRESVAQLAPYLGGRLEELDGWDRVKLLTVQINRLRRWCAPGMLCIGDAAHAMSPAGGVGINLAIQDAVATANLLTGPLLRGTLTEGSLAAVQRRRELPARVTQAAQVQVHKVFAYAFEHPGPLRAPLALRVASQLPGVHRLVGHMVGIGVRPEHVQKSAQERPTSAVVVGTAVGKTLGALALGVRWITRQAAAASCSGARRVPRLVPYS